MQESREIAALPFDFAQGRLAQDGGGPAALVRAFKFTRASNAIPVYGPVTHAVRHLFLACGSTLRRQTRRMKYSFGRSNIRRTTSSDRFFR